MAGDAFNAMPEEEQILYATAIILSIDAANLVHVLEASGNLIGRHAHNVAANAMPRRSDGSRISPYAPDGGPVRVIS